MDSPPKCDANNDDPCTAVVPCLGWGQNRVCGFVSVYDGPCGANAATCSELTTVTACATTPDGTFTDDGDGTCSLTCNNGFYVPGNADGTADGSTCCGANVATCSASDTVTACATTPDGTFIDDDADGACSLTCNNGFYVTGNADGTANGASCSECGANVATCSASDTVTACATTPDGSFIDADGACSLTCNNGFYVTGNADGTANGASCSECGANVATCSASDTVTACATTSDGTFTDDGDGTCSLTCNKDFHNWGDTCMSGTIQHCSDSPPCPGLAVITCLGVVCECDCRV